MKKYLPYTLLFILLCVGIAYTHNGCPYPEPLGCPNSIINTFNNTFKGDITMQGDITFSGNGNGLTYGEIYTKNSTATLTVDADLTHTEVTSFTVNGVSNGTTPSHASDIITIDTAGKYKIQVSTVVENAGVAAHEIHMEMHKNSGANEGANSKYVSNVCTAAGDDCPADDLMYVTHSFVNGEVVYSTVTEMGMTTLVEYYICEVTGTTSFGLSDHVDGGGANCDAGDGDQINLTEDLTPTGKLVIVGTSIPNVHAHGDLRATTENVSMPLSGIVDLAANDTISIWIWTDDSTARVVTVSDITFSIFQIGG